MVEELGGLFRGSGSQENDIDLDAAAGIRTDSAGVALVRKKIVPEMRGWTHVERDRDPINWDRSVLASLVDDIRSHGGSVVLYDMPISTSAQSVIDSNRTLKRDRTALHEWLTQNNIPLVTADLAYDDTDFPDLSHLRSSRAVEFSRSLARGIGGLQGPPGGE